MAIPLRSIHYQWESLLYKKKYEKKETYQQQFGYEIISRDEQGFAKEVVFSLYVNNDAKEIHLIGSFNDWKKQEKYKFQPKKNGFQQLIVKNCKHKDQYLFLSNGQYLRDPAATYFDKEGNCIFWDFEDPTSYKKKFSSPDTLHRASIILQTDLPGLVSRWFLYNKQSKSLDKSAVDLYTYIRTCGVLDMVKDLGFNTIQFLPISQSIDGDNWKFRYLTPFPFAIQKNWGDPDSFLALIDACHELGISVIADIILSHAAYKNYSLFNLKGEDVGLHIWKTNEEEVFLDEETSWGTKRFRYSDEHVRQYLIESALHFLTKYSIDGFRIDNVDGILRLGTTGQGEDRPGGRIFLQKLINSLYEHNPLTLIHLEAHYFYGDNAKLLVLPQAVNNKALGATAYNSSRLTYYFHTEMMPKAADDISVWKFEHIREEKEWGQSNSTIADFHNHDAAAGLMDMRATGSYAFDALILNNPGLTEHAIGKIKIMESIIAFGCEGRLLDLLQTFLLQKGTFEHDSSIHWELLKEEKNYQVVSYKKEINNLLQHPAFWPENTIYRKFVNIDEVNKILVIKREDNTQETNELFYVIINLSGATVEKYAVGVEQEQSFEVVFNSDEIQYAGAGNVVEKQLEKQESNRFEHYSKEIIINSLSPYSIIVVKSKR